MESAIPPLDREAHSQAFIKQQQPSFKPEFHGIIGLIRVAIVLPLRPFSLSLPASHFSLSSFKTVGEGGEVVKD